MLKSMLVFIVIFVCSSVYSVELPTCAAKFDHNAFVHQAMLGGKVLKNSLNNLQKCVHKNNVVRDKLDFTAIEMVMRLDNGEMDKAYRTQSKVQDLISIFELCAHAGSKSAQHNLATLYNSNSSGHIFKLMGKNHEKFVYWTRQAAANGDPRSIFNLAVRMATTPENSVKGIPIDHELAYKSFMAIAIIGQKTDIGYLILMIKREVAKLRNKIGDKRMRELLNEINTFELKQLAS